MNFFVQKKRCFFICSYFFALFLSSCSLGSSSSLEDWIAEKDLLIQPVSLPVIEKTKFEKRVNYLIETDPFQSTRVGVSSFYETKKKVFIDYSKYLRSPPLSHVSLSDISLIGLILNNKKRVALVQYGQDIFHVSVGFFVGSNRGVVSTINEHGMEVIQKFDDGTGRSYRKKTFLSVS